MAETSDTHILEPATILSGATQESGVVDDLRREASQTACRTLSAQEGISLNDSNRVVNPGVAFPSSMLAVLTDVTETNIDKWLDTDSLA